MASNALRQRQGSYARGEDTRRRILQTALEVFAAEGYEGASTRLLAERAGVNLPAIQYYFGSKEGLYRAVIENIVQHNEMHLAPLSLKLKVALDDPATPKERLLDLLCEMLESFVALLSSGGQDDSRRLFYARAEIECTAGLDFLHKHSSRQVFDPCLALVARLLHKSTDDPDCIVRTLMLLGQATIFCNRGVRDAIGLNVEDRLGEICGALRSSTKAIMRAAMAQAQRHTPTTEPAPESTDAD
ncbi:MAG: CerR family C-terminal domain-containing protein [Proteobacteria bacterium]|nr:CerR family C-terminal domain-containing protein [Pseudomonadota bacterium]